MIYLDWAASAIPHTNAIDAAYKIATTTFGNPSSFHQAGISSKLIIEQSRSQLANFLHCKKNNLYFCSSGTEANNIIISSLYHSQTIGSILTSPIEHASIYKPLQKLKSKGWEIIEAPISPNGIIDSTLFLNQIKDNTRELYLINICNENGAIQPITEISKRLKEINKNRKRKIKMHVDMVQALGKISIDLSHLSIDSASFSGHKIGAVRGSGLLYLNRFLDPIYAGGGQESGIRSGTENSAAIYSLQIAAKNAVKNQTQKIEKALLIKSKLIKSIQNFNLPILPSNKMNELLNPKLYSPWILQIAIPPLPSEVILRIFNDNGIALSGGSACSSNSREKLSRIAKALKYPASLTESMIRISYGPTTSINEIDQFLLILKDKILPLANSF